MLGSNVHRSYIAFQGLLIASHTVHAGKIRHLPYFKGLIVWKNLTLHSLFLHKPMADGTFLYFENGGVTLEVDFTPFFPQTLTPGRQ